MTIKRRAHLCSAPDCRTLVLGEMFCYRHRAPAPAGAWAEAQHIRDELEPQHDEHEPQDAA
jgi:hypothetical protein